MAGCHSYQGLKLTLVVFLSLVGLTVVCGAWHATSRIPCCVCVTLSTVHSDIPDGNAPHVALGGCPRGGVSLISCWGTVSLSVFPQKSLIQTWWLAAWRKKVFSSGVVVSLGTQVMWLHLGDKVEGCMDTSQSSLLCDVDWECHKLRKKKQMDTVDRGSSHIWKCFRNLVLTRQRAHKPLSLPSSFASLSFPPPVHFLLSSSPQSFFPFSFPSFSHLACLEC